MEAIPLPFRGYGDRYEIRGVLRGPNGLELKGAVMKFLLFKEVALARDIPEEGLKKGDIAMVVDHHPASGGEDGYSLEVFNALGETIVVTVVPESAIEALHANQILSARPLAKSA